MYHIPAVHLVPRPVALWLYGICYMVLRTTIPTVRLYACYSYTLRYTLGAPAAMPTYIPSIALRRTTSTWFHLYLWVGVETPDVHLVPRPVVLWLSGICHRYFVPIYGMVVCILHIHPEMYHYPVPV